MPCVDLDPFLQCAPDAVLLYDEQWQVRPGPMGVGEECLPGFFDLPLDGEVCHECLYRSHDAVCPGCHLQSRSQVGVRNSSPS